MENQARVYIGLKTIADDLNLSCTSSSTMQVLATAIFQAV